MDAVRLSRLIWADSVHPQFFFSHLIFCQIYDTATGHQILTLHDSNNSNNYSKNLASFNPTDDLVLNDGVLWDVKGKRVIHKFDKFNNFVSGVFHPSGLEIIINSEIVSLENYQSLTSLFLSVTDPNSNLHNYKMELNNALYIYTSRQYNTSLTTRIIIRCSLSSF